MSNNPADAVREAHTELERIIADLYASSDFAKQAGDGISSVLFKDYADRLVALAGAAPVMTIEMNEKGGATFTLPDLPAGKYELFTHAPAKAREGVNQVSLDLYEVAAYVRNQRSADGLPWPQSEQVIGALDELAHRCAALATFAEGAE